MAEMTSHVFEKTYIGDSNEEMSSSYFTSKSKGKQIFSIFYIMFLNISILIIVMQYILFNYITLFYFILQNLRRLFHTTLRILSRKAYFS